MAKRSFHVPVGRYSGVPVIPLDLSRKRFRKRLRQWRKAARALALGIIERYRRAHPEVAAALRGPCPYDTPSRKESVLDILDTAPLNLRGTSPL